MLVHSIATATGFPAETSESGLRDFPPLAKKSPPVRVLIVDDEPLIRWSLAETLTEQGYAVLEAGDGKGAVAVLENPTALVEVIMLDYRLPDSNDLHLLATIRDLSPHSRVVMMTAYGTPDLAARALRLGAVSVVTKPIEMQDVVDLVAWARRAAPGRRADAGSAPYTGADAAADGAHR